MRAPTVSIVLPARDAAGTLRGAVESCLGQTWRDLELVVVDDGSRDGTGDLAEREGWRREPRVRWLRHPRPLGVCAATATATSAARGRWIARMDADDVNEPGRIERQLAFLEANPDIGVAGCRVRIRTGDGGQVGKGFRLFEHWLNALCEPEAIARERFVESPVVNPTFLMRRELWDRFGGPRDGPFPEDYDLWLRMLGAGVRIAKVPEMLFEWRDTPGRLTRTDPRYSQDAFLACKAEHLARLSDVAARGAAVCGAGPIGKRIARELVARGVRVVRFFEVHPRRIGETIHGAPVVSQDELGPWTSVLDSRREPRPVLLGAVGIRGRRAAVRELAAAHGFREGADFFCVA